LKSFWKRTAAKGDLSIAKKIISQQATDYSHKEALAMQLERLVAEKTNSAGEPCKLSILELGCANGVLIRHFRRYFPLVSLKFVGFEVADMLVDDFRLRYPEHRVEFGGAEEFIDMSDDDFEEAPFDVFLASYSLCMIKPDLVSKVLKRAAGLANTILIWDNLANSRGQLCADHAVFLQPIGVPHLIFSHMFENMLNELGFDRVEHVPTPLKKQTITTGTGEQITVEAIDSGQIGTGALVATRSRRRQRRGSKKTSRRSRSAPRRGSRKSPRKKAVPQSPILVMTSYSNWRKRLMGFPEATSNPRQWDRFWLKTTIRDDVDQGRIGGGKRTLAP
jgi:hypothetical protein